MKGQGPRAKMSAKAGATYRKIERLESEKTPRTLSMGKVRQMLRLYSKQGMKLADMEPDSKELKEAKKEFQKMSSSLLKNADKLGSEEFK